jgi:hypothetical protein
MPRTPRIFRYRRPSVNELLGISQAKRRISRKLGLATLRDPTTPIKNMERRMRNRAGYYSEPMKLARASGCLKRGGGCGILVIALLVAAIYWIS